MAREGLKIENRRQRASRLPIRRKIVLPADARAGRLPEQYSDGLLAVMKQPQPAGRKISDCILLAKAHEKALGYAQVPDEDFARDVQEGIDAHREPIRNVWDE